MDPWRSFCERLRAASPCKFLRDSESTNGDHGGESMRHLSQYTAQILNNGPKTQQIGHKKWRGFSIASRLEMCARRISDNGPERNGPLPVSILSHLLTRFFLSFTIQTPSRPIQSGFFSLVYPFGVFFVLFAIFLIRLSDGPSQTYLNFLKIIFFTTSSILVKNGFERVFW